MQTGHHLSEGDRRRGHVQNEAVAVTAGGRHADGVGAQGALKKSRVGGGGGARSEARSATDAPE